MKDAYDAQLKKYERGLVTFLVLHDLATNQVRLNTLAQRLEDEVNTAFKTYQQMKEANKSEEDIQKTIKPIVAKFLQEDLVNPTLQKYDLKD